MRFLPDNRLIAIGTIALPLLALASAIGGGIVYTVRLRDDATASRQCDVDHENRLRVLESVASDLRADVRETNTNVGWIRTFLDPHRQPGKAKDASQTAINEP
jgi:hypothetical protein